MLRAYAGVNEEEVYSSQQEYMINTCSPETSKHRSAIAKVQRPRLSRHVISCLTQQTGKSSWPRQVVQSDVHQISPSSSTHHPKAALSTSTTASHENRPQRMKRERRMPDEIPCSYPREESRSDCSGAGNVG